MIYEIPRIGLLTSVDVVPLMKTADVVENSGHCIYSIGLNCLSLFHLVFYIYIYIYDISEYKHSMFRNVFFCFLLLASYISQSLADSRIRRGRLFCVTIIGTILRSVSTDIVKWSDQLPQGDEDKCLTK